MVWVHVAVVAVFLNVALSQSIRCPINKCAPTVPTIAPTVVPTTAPTIVDGNIVQSLIDTLQLFIVSDLIADTLPEKKCCIQTIPEPYFLDYDDCVPLWMWVWVWVWVWVWMWVWVWVWMWNWV
ncbi:uncharacterized protein LOC134676805 [Cydia fagiglandana]|uniref:uncharacterized protein LOC134676805 n=1 Tax=Cydia fagiglandana TaxID=1458189 RepID=UPI002FEE497E